MFISNQQQYSMNINSSNKSTLDVLKIGSTDPYQKGYQHGQALKDKINVVFTAGLQILQFVQQQDKTFDPQKMSAHILNHTSEAVVQELKGLSAGSGIDYETVVQVNMLPVLCPQLMACTSLAACKVGAQTYALSEDNTVATRTVMDDFEEQLDMIPEEEREEALEEYKNIKKKSEEACADYKKHGSVHHTLQKFNGFSTIRSKVFDPNTCSVDVALSNFPDNMVKDPLNYYHFSSKVLFEQESSAPTLLESAPRELPTFTLGHNLDFSGVSQLGRDNPFSNNQLLLIRAEEGGLKTASFTFPGMIGITEGMNSAGVSMSVLTQASNPPSTFGEHNHFVFYERLAHSKTANEFITSLEERNLAAPINLIGCDASTAFAAEWYKSVDAPGYDYMSKIDLNTF